eukprot:2693457-Rhodomonas_salina.1
MGHFYRSRCAVHHFYPPYYGFKGKDISPTPAPAVTLTSANRMRAGLPFLVLKHYQKRAGAPSLPPSAHVRRMRQRMRLSKFRLTQFSALFLALATSSFVRIPTPDRDRCYCYLAAQIRLYAF